jgi:hypothetical protein
MRPEKPACAPRVEERIRYLLQIANRGDSRGGSRAC